HPHAHRPLPPPPRPSHLRSARRQTPPRLAPGRLCRHPRPHVSHLHRLQRRQRRRHLRRPDPWPLALLHPSCPHRPGRLHPHLLHLALCQPGLDRQRAQLPHRVHHLRPHQPLAAHQPTTPPPHLRHLRGRHDHLQTPNHHRPPASRHGATVQTAHSNSLAPVLGGEGRVRGPAPSPGTPGEG